MRVQESNGRSISPHLSTHCRTYVKCTASSTLKLINPTVRYFAHSLAVTPGRCCCSVKLQLCHTTQCQQTRLEQAHSKWQPQHGVITVDANTQGNVGYNEQASPLQPVSPLSSMDCRSCTPSYFVGARVQSLIQCWYEPKIVWAAEYGYTYVCFLMDWHRLLYYTVSIVLDCNSC